MGFFSFKKRQRSPAPRVVSMAIEIVSHRTGRDYTWNWRVKGSRLLNPVQGARVDALVGQYCTAQAQAATAGSTRTQVITVLLP
jgi:hypothetical protein